MILSRLPRIKEFPADNRPWRLDWFGAVHQNDKKDSEPDIEVVLSPFIGNPKIKPDANKSIDKKQRKVVRVGVGTLPCLHVGSIWKNGYALQLNDYNYRREVLRGLKISHDSVNIIAADHREDGEYVLNPDYYSFGEQFIDAPILAIPSRWYKFILIPFPEIIRFYYAQSSELAKLLFWGKLAGPHDWLFCDKESGYLNGSDYLLRLRKSLDTNIEAKITARLAATEIAKARTSDINLSIASRRSQNAPCYPVTLPPFDGVTTLTARGKRIKWSKTENTWCFLVFWLESCSAPLPFDNVVIECDDKPRLESFVVDDQEGRGGSRPIIIEYDKKIRDNNRNGLLRSDVEPCINTTKNFVIFNEDRFPSLKNVKVFQNKTDLTIYRERKASIDLPAMETVGADYSTGDGVYDLKEARRLSLVTDEGVPERPRAERKPALLPSFDTVYKGLMHLQDKHPDQFSFALIPVSGNPDDYYDSAIGTINKFPIKSRDVILKKSFMDSKKTRRRDVLIAEINFDSNIFYFVEPEHILNKRNREYFTALFLYDDRFNSIGNDTMQAILVRCSENAGVWYRKHDKHFPTVHRKKFKHTWSDAKRLADRLFRQIKRVMKKRSADAVQAY